MCRRAQCEQCGKPGYVGCGRHVEQVLAGVPRAERCRCRERGAERDGTHDAGPGDAASATSWHRWWKW